MEQIKKTITKVLKNELLPSTDGSKSLTNPRPNLMKETFSKSLKILTANYRTLVITEQQMVIWYEMLKDLADEQMVGAVSAFCASHKEIYPGTNIVAHLREYALYDPYELSPAAAYEVARKAWKRWSSYELAQRKPFKNALIEKTIQTLGPSEILNSTNQDVLRAHFMRIYESYQDREKMHKMRGYTTVTSDGLRKLLNNND